MQIKGSRKDGEDGLQFSKTDLKLIKTSANFAVEDSPLYFLLLRGGT